MCKKTKLEWYFPPTVLSLGSASLTCASGWTLGLWHSARTSGQLLPMLSVLATPCGLWVWHILIQALEVADVLPQLHFSLPTPLPSPSSGLSFWVKGNVDVSFTLMSFSSLLVSLNDFLLAYCPKAFVDFLLNKLSLNYTLLGIKFCVCVVLVLLPCGQVFIESPKCQPLLRCCRYHREQDRGFLSLKSISSPRG